MSDDEAGGDITGHAPLQVEDVMHEVGVWASTVAPRSDDGSPDWNRNGRLSPKMAAYIEWFLSMPAIPIQPRLRPVTELVARLERSSRPNSRPLVCGLLRHVERSPSVDAVFQKMRRCGVWGSREKKGFHVNERKFCGLPLCPACGEHLRKGEAASQWARLRDAIGTDIDSSKLHFATINGPVLALGSDYAPALKKFKTALRNRIYRTIAGSKWAGHFEISIRGMLHFHGWVYTPDQDREEALQLLQRSFRDPRDVMLQKPDSDDIEKEILHAGEYAADISLWLRNRHGKTPQVLHDLIHSIESIRMGRYVGIRFECGLRNIRDGVFKIGHSDSESSGFNSDFHINPSCSSLSSELSTDSNSVISDESVGCLLDGKSDFDSGNQPSSTSTTHDSIPISQLIACSTSSQSIVDVDESMKGQRRVRTGAKKSPDDGQGAPPEPSPRAGTRVTAPRADSS